MFNSKDAKSLVDMFYSRGEELSQEWLVKTCEDILNKIKNSANKGYSEFKYEANDLENDKYKIVKCKLVLTELKRLGFKVGVSEKSIKAPLMKKTMVFEISWE